MYHISISATIPFLCRGEPCWLWTSSWAWSRQPSSCQTSSLLFFFSSFSLDFRRCWRFSNQVDNDLKSKKCFFNWDPDFTGLYRGLPCWRRGDAGWHQGLLCWHRGVPSYTVFTPGWRQSLPVSAVFTPGSAVFTPGWRWSRRPSTRFFNFNWFQIWIEESFV